ncbi:MAG TPA: serine/threonine-protein kinase [Pirellulales bacterium]
MSGAKNQTSCDDVELDVLLFGDERSGEYQRSAAHVETCVECQQRLTQCAADDGDWNNVPTMLRKNRPNCGAKLPGEDHEFASQSAVFQAPVQLDFLAPPSHPEMLGRLGRYEIEQIIGRGGMGVVFKGFDTQLHRVVAIKVLAPHLAHSGPARQRFDREARAAASIVHEHVVAIHDVQSDGASPYLVMQFVPGRSLQERISQDGPLLPMEILRIGVQAAAGLAAAHAQGVIHRDVKPANILLENGIDRALLTDFGLARAADDATLTHSGIIAGTPHYMSPEQARGKPADARSDLFSLGAVLYFMATGHPPFRAEQAMAILNRICHDRHRDVQPINPAIPDDLADAIDRLLEKKPGRRFATAEEVRQTLERSLAALQKPGGLGIRRIVRKMRHRRRSLLAAVCVLLMLAGSGWLIGKVVRGTPAVNDDGGTPVQNAPIDASLVEFLRGDDASFAHQLATARQSLTEFELGAFPEFRVGSLGENPWRNEAQNVETELTQLEQIWSSRANFETFESQIGVKR